MYTYTYRPTHITYVCLWTHTYLLNQRMQLCSQPGLRGSCKSFLSFFSPEVNNDLDSPSALFSLHLLPTAASPSQRCRRALCKGSHVRRTCFGSSSPVSAVWAATCPSGHSGTSFCGPPCHSLCLLSGWSSCFLDLVSSSRLVYSPSWSTWSRTGTCQYPNLFRSRVWMADCEQ